MVRIMLVGEYSHFSMSPYYHGQAQPHSEGKLGHTIPPTRMHARIVITPGLLGLGLALLLLVQTLLALLGQLLVLGFDLGGAVV